LSLLLISTSIRLFAKRAVRPCTLGQRRDLTRELRVREHRLARVSKQRRVGVHVLELDRPEFVRLTGIAKFDALRLCKDRGGQLLRRARLTNDLAQVDQNVLALAIRVDVAVKFHVQSFR